MSLNNKPRAIAYLLGAIAFATSQDAIVKALAGGYPTWEAVAFRGATAIPPFLIWGYFARLNPGRLRLGLLAYVEVSLDRTTPDAFERFKQVMLAHDEVMECHMVAGGFDYLLKVRVTDMESYRRFLGDRIASVRGVQQTHTYFVMEEVKSTHRIIVPESA